MPLSHVRVLRSARKELKNSQRNERNHTTTKYEIKKIIITKKHDESVCLTNDWESRRNTIQVQVMIVFQTVVTFAYKQNYTSGHCFHSQFAHAADSDAHSRSRMRWEGLCRNKSEQTRKLYRHPHYPNYHSDNYHMINQIEQINTDLIKPDCKTELTQHCTSETSERHTALRMQDQALLERNNKKDVHETRTSRFKSIDLVIKPH